MDDHMLVSLLICDMAQIRRIWEIFLISNHNIAAHSVLPENDVTGGRSLCGKQTEGFMMFRFEKGVFDYSITTSIMV